MIGYSTSSFDDHRAIAARDIDLGYQRVFAAVAMKRTSASKPPLSPAEPGFNVTDAMSWAKGCPEREAELRTAMFGVPN